MTTLIELFISFCQIGMFSIGGGYAAMPLIQEQVVQNHGWLSLAQFTDLVTISEMTPGPIALNAASFVGLQVAGFPGAIVATIGNVLPSFIIVSILAYVYYRFSTIKVISGVITGLRPTVVALIATAGLTIVRNALGGSQLLFNGILLLLALFLVRNYKKDPIFVIVLTGMCGIIVEFIGNFV
ncbi:chromate transporter [Erysipelothrix urinaevulpis]|uniref:chromate transporter n=1 Tax=Erysipelothrix urinaevulpis TaxID=2683717 RepID=UPI00135CA172|nr:chromate transporter [Erysipelothrix urinaevulpis]